MKYKGIELVEITEPQVFSPPRDMLVVDELDDEPKEKSVVAIIDNGTNHRVIVQEGACKFTCYQLCFEIPEEPKPRRATLRELAKWCAQGNGQIQDANQLNCVFTGLDYGPDCDDRAAPDIYKVRKWDDRDWHEPDVQYMGLEAK